MVLTSVTDNFYVRVILVFPVITYTDSWLGTLLFVKNRQSISQLWSNKIKDLNPTRNQILYLPFGIILLLGQKLCSEQIVPLTISNKANVLSSQMFHPSTLWYVKVFLYVQMERLYGILLQ